jgi:site-specific recombinase XerD
MLDATPNIDACLSRLFDRLESEGYCRKVITTYLGPCRRFLKHLQGRKLTVHTAQAKDVDRYLKGLRMITKPGAPATSHLRRQHRAGIHHLLRLFHDKWPPTGPMSKAERSRDELVAAYDEWLNHVRGLAVATRTLRRAEAHTLLTWWHQRTSKLDQQSLGVADLDAYVQWRSRTVRRTSVPTICGALRSFLRYLHGCGRIAADLSTVILAPRVYKLDGIPSTLRGDAVTRMLRAARKKRSAVGRRDYAILKLLVTYGLRGCELVALRLEDIDWRNERLQIRHTKTKTHAELPLLRGPAEAILDYLRYGRPKSPRREVFLRSIAPYRALCGAPALYKIVKRNLVDPQLLPPGRRGSHALRHARAASLLDGAVPLKTIGDVLGHRSPSSTMIYLQWATKDLRNVALEVPAGVTP